MVKPSLEKVCTVKGNFDLFEFSWPVDTNLSLPDAYKLAYQFGESMDSSAKKPIPNTGKSFYGVIVWNQTGDPYSAEDSGDLQLYKNWNKLETDVMNAAKQQNNLNEQIFGFHIGFKTVDISYSLRSLVEMATASSYTPFGEFAVASVFDIRKELEQFVKQTNPSADLSELSKLASYKLRKLM